MDAPSLLPAASPPLVKEPLIIFQGSDPGSNHPQGPPTLAQMPSFPLVATSFLFSVLEQADALS